MVDDTSVRAHRCAAGGKGGRAEPSAGPERGWVRQRAAPEVRSPGPPMAVVLTPGHRHEQTAFRELMQRGAVKRRGPGRSKLHARTIVGDKGYTGRPVRDYLRRHGISAIIPQLKIENTPRLMDWGLYRASRGFSPAPLRSLTVLLEVQNPPTFPSNSQRSSSLSST
jgi:hypothetical protein